MGRGSLYVAKHFVAADAPGHPPSITRKPSLMHLQYLLSNGCRTRECIQQYLLTRVDRDILEICIKKGGPGYVCADNFSMESFRKGAYHQFAL